MNVVIVESAAADLANYSPRSGQLNPWLHMGLHLAIREDLVDHDYIATRTTGFDAVRAGVAASWPDRVERITGVSVADLRRTLEILTSAKSAMILTALPEVLSHLQLGTHAGQRTA